MNERDLHIKQKKEFSERLKIALTWTGTCIALVSAIVYLMVIYVLIEGFEQQLESQKLVTFVILGVIVGVLISGSLRFQGVAFAKSLDVCKAQLKEYHDLLGKSKRKLKSIKSLYIWSTLSDIVFKGALAGFTIYYSISFVIDGIKDQSYFIMAFANVFLFIGFGLIGLAKGYDFYLENHFPWLQQKINILKEEQNELLRSTQRNGNEGIRSSSGTGNDQSNPVQEGSGGASVEGEPRVVNEA